jgi:hypothetical protein
MISEASNRGGVEEREEVASRIWCCNIMNKGAAHTVPVTRKRGTVALSVHFLASTTWSHIPWPMGPPIDGA